MVNYLSDSIADFYVKKNIILQSEKEVYKFGISLILNDIVTFALILTISALFAEFSYGMEFLLCFCLTRIFTGGYHASKAWLCRVSMLAVSSAVLFIPELIGSISQLWIAVMSAASFFISAVLAPIKHPNKELTPELVRRGKIGTIAMYLIFFLLSVLAYRYIGMKDALVIALSLSAVSALVIIGKFTNERSENK